MNFLKWVRVSAYEKKEFWFIHKLIPFLVFEGLLLGLVLFFVNVLNISIPLSIFYTGVIMMIGYAYFAWDFWRLFSNHKK